MSLAENLALLMQEMKKLYIVMLFQSQSDMELCLKSVLMLMLVLMLMSMIQFVVRFHSNFEFPQLRLNLDLSMKTSDWSHQKCYEQK